MSPLKIVLFSLISIFAFASEPFAFDLTYPTVTKSSKLQEERYDKLTIFVKGQGYIPVYGHTWKQDFKYPKFEDGNYNEIIKAFIVEKLKIKPSEINSDNYGHFTIDGKEYWLKLSTYSASYSYALLRVEDYPETVTLDENANHVFTERYTKRFGKVTFAPNIAIPLVKDFAIGSITYKKYDEYTFFYNRKANLHKGMFWNITFKKNSEDTNSCRYAIPHDYKNNLLKLGATILEDKDNTVQFRLEQNGTVNIIKFGADNNSFSIQIIQEEPFKQSLVLSPDKIKSELDKNGQITLDGIYFDFNKATLKPESNKAILSTVALMQRYTDLVISIHGHTDSKGSDTYNMTLSADRAASVRNAIASKGIENSRLQSQGYGESEPIATNDTDDGRAENRRVELHKVSGGNEKSIITIDFIKPLDNSVVDSKDTHQNGSLGIQYTKPYSPQKDLKEFKGHLDVISYKIIKDGKLDESISRKEIIKNYENVLELYSAEILGKHSNTLYFKIKDRGDGVSIYGRIEGYSSSYTIRFLSPE